MQNFDKEKMAKAVGRDLPISYKNSVEVCRYLKKKEVAKAKKILEDAIALKKPIPFKRFNKGIAHKKGMMSGSYAVNTCKSILALLKSAEANAAQKNISNPVIIHMCANKASNTWRYGRHSRRKAKRAHVEIVLAEKQAKVNEEKIGKKED